MLSKEELSEQLSALTAKASATQRAPNPNPNPKSLTLIRTL